MTETARSARMAEVRLDDAMIASMRSRIGLSLRIDDCRNNDVATRYAVLRFAEGIGDTNPLWTDDDHAASSPYGEIVAPPTWPYCCFSGTQFGWPGLGAFHASSDLTFHRPVHLGDRITPECIYDGFDGPKPSSFAGEAVTDHFRQTYHNQRGELVMELHKTVVHYERGEAKSRADSRRVEERRWTDEELTAVDADVLAERPRGAEPRYWEDVGVGDELDTLTKGPVGLTDEIAFIASGAAPIPRIAAHAASLRQYRDHPKWAFRDPDTQALEPIYAVHYNTNAAKAMGVSRAYDVGVQRTCWQVHGLTHWMGDDGWLKTASSSYRGFVYHGDVVRLGGRVTAKDERDGDGDATVHLETWATSQRGQNVMPGSAVVALPTRGGDRPVERRVGR